jgi:hypothetical protein
VKTQQSEYNNKTFRGAVQRDSNVVGERFWRDFSYYYPSYFLLWVVVLKNYDANISRFITDKK